MEDNDERDLDPFDGMWIIDSVVIFTRYEQLMNPLSNSGPTSEPKLKIMDSSENLHTEVIRGADHEYHTHFA
ncbi:hypothetical protein Y032_0027g1597 [Ancylostoma ceylanicum]|uniref:Uncharacterized protein n=1 Tax=Ancylostoma ceylanicum TaxID=53326 RepID=A0A016UTV4_9BILA|nr:hypothetical protein Y032_0027g1597 [Ancylostoma ceylanicum]